MIICPKCGHRHEPILLEDDIGEWECNECGFLFRVLVEYNVIYTSTCLEHDFGEWFEMTSDPTIECRKCKVCKEMEARVAVSKCSCGLPIEQDSCPGCGTWHDLYGRR